MRNGDKLKYITYKMVSNKQVNHMIFLQEVLNPILCLIVETQSITAIKL
jgi:hypothetical protein